MPTLGVEVAVIHRRAVLLVERDDFEVWCMPGGYVDEGESLAQAATREVREETGIDVELTRLVGVYSRPCWAGRSHHIVLFAALPLRGELVPQPGEVKRVDYFNLDELPQPLLWGTRQVLSDALCGHVGFVRTMEATLEVSYSDLIAQRDASGLPPSDFYERHIAAQLGTGEMRTDIHLEAERL